MSSLVPRSPVKSLFHSGLVLATALTAATLLSATSARAQYGYPPGYGAWGWGGWGGGGSTVEGNTARGLGVMAAGVGQYNVQTAQAAAINSQTLMSWNQYMYLSQLETNKRYHEKLARQKQGNARSREEVYRRLRDNPTASDINRGDALNVALDEINNPKIYAKVLKSAKAKVDGKMIRDIPFQYASAAITTSVAQVTKGGAPAALKRDEFSTERTALRELAAELRKQVEEQGAPSPETLQKVRDQLKLVRTKVESLYPRNTPERNDSEKFLKAVYGLTRMLETPAINVLLAGVENRPDTTLGELLEFMNAFNLRFGAANNERQKQIYAQIYPLLLALRDEAARGLAGTSASAEPGTASHESPGAFFQGMEYKHLEPKNVPPPPKPEAR